MKELITFTPKAKIYTYVEPVNMCSSFPKLSRLVRDKLGKTPESGDIFLFINSKRNYLKILFYSANGKNILAKSLPSGTFNSKKTPITMSELARLVNEVVIDKKVITEVKK